MISLRKLVIAVGAAFVGSALPGSAAATVSASIHLTAPSSVTSKQAWDVTAYGHSPFEGYIWVLLTKKSRCPSTVYGGVERGGAHPLSFGGNDAARVSKGTYSVRSQEADYAAWWGSGTRELCGMLYRKGQSTNTKPEAHTTTSINVTQS